MKCESVQRAAILLLFAAGGAALTRAQVAPGDVLKVLSVTKADGSSGALANVDLLNAGNKTITDFGLAVVGNSCSVAFDSLASPEIDKFVQGNGHSSAGPYPDGIPPVGTYRGGIPSGERARYTTGASSFRWPLMVEVCAVVFADDSAIGDEAEIAEIFAHRKAAATEYIKWCAILQSSAFRAAFQANSQAALQDFAGQIHAADAKNPPPKTVRPGDAPYDYAADNVREQFEATVDHAVTAVDQGRLESVSKMLEYLSLGCAAQARHMTRKAGVQ